MSGTTKEKLPKTDAPRAVPQHSNKKWVKPMLEDVSGKVMAQPYIRFT